MKRLAVLILIVPLCAGLFVSHAAKRSKEKSDLIFEAIVLRLGPPTPPTGMVTHYRLAKYRVERVCHGRYAGAEIVVDHFSLTGRELEGIKEGDRVFVAVDKAKKIIARKDAEGIRDPSDEVKTFYIGGGVAPPKADPGDCIAEAGAGVRINNMRVF